MPFARELSFLGVSFLCFAIGNWASVLSRKLEDNHRFPNLFHNILFWFGAVLLFAPGLPVWLLLEYPRVYRHKRLLRMYDADIAKMRQVIRVAHLPQNQQPAAAEAYEDDYVWVSLDDYERYVLSRLTMDRNSNL